MNVLQRFFLNLALAGEKRKDIMQLIRWGLGDEETGKAWKYMDFVQEGYEQNPVVYACLRHIQQALTQLSIDILDKGEPIPSDVALPVEGLKPVRSLLERPNTDQAFPEFIKLWVTELYLGGITYIEATGVGVDMLGTRERAKASPEFWLVRPDRVEMKYRGRELIEYIIDPYQPEQRKLTPDEMFNIKLNSPGKSRAGMPPLRPAIQALLSINNALKFNNKLLANAAVPAMLLLLKGIDKLNREQRKAIEDEFQERYRGPDKAGSVIVQSAESSELHELGKSPRDMMWGETLRESSRLVCAVLGVPSVLLGDPSARTYSNMESARKDLYEITVVPAMRLFMSEAESYLWRVLRLDPNRFGLAVNTSQVGVLAENTDQLFLRTKTADWLTINEQRELTDHDALTGNPDTDVPRALLKPAVPAALALPPGERKKRAVKIEFPDSIYPTRAGRDGAVESFDRARRRYDAKLIRLMQEHWRAQSRKVERLMTGAGTTLSIPAYQQRKSLDDIQRELDLLLQGEADELAEKMEPLVRGIIIDFGMLGMAEAKPGGFFQIDDFDVAGKIAADLRERARLIETITSADELKSIIQQGFDEGVGIPEVTSRILDKYGDWEDYRADRIARTETNRASMQGTMEAYRQAGVAGKEWITARDDRVRESHVMLDGTIIEIDEMFDVGMGQAEAPGQSGIAGEDINCRCRIAPVVASEMPGGGL